MKRDRICCVMANECHVNVIRGVLETFLPGCQPLDPNYAEHPYDDEIKFQSEEEMLHFFIQNDQVTQSFYWKKQQDNPARLMVGADITDDGKLIVSLTMDATQDSADALFSELKDFLKSDIGTVTHTILPEYADGKDFIERYQSVECLAE